MGGRRISWFLMVSIALLAVPIPVIADSDSGSDGRVITTGPVDQAGFQALVDAASPGDTIACLGGVYDFSAPGPVFLDKGLKIVAAEAATPALFVGDGTVNTDYFTGNNGFLQTQDSFVDGLKIQGLHFQDFDRTIALGVTFDDSVEDCPQIPGAGSRNVEILDNTIRNTRRGVQIFGGPAEDYRIAGNDIEALRGFGQYGIFLFAGDFFCPAGGGVDGHVALVRLADGVVENNRVESDIGVEVDGVEEVSVERNHFEGAFLGVSASDSGGRLRSDTVSFGVIEDNVIVDPGIGVFAAYRTLQDVRIENNRVLGAQFFGIHLTLGVNRFTVENNWIELEGPAFGLGFGILIHNEANHITVEENLIEGAVVGVLLGGGASHNRVEDNEFRAISDAEVWLGYDESGGDPWFPPDTFDNVVEAQASDRVFDFGVNNDVEIDSGSDSDSD